jgi:hypothetical protein
MKLAEGGADNEHVAQEVQGQEDSMGIRNWRMSQRCPRGKL